MLESDFETIKRLLSQNLFCKICSGLSYYCYYYYFFSSLTYNNQPTQVSIALTWLYSSEMLAHCKQNVWHAYCHPPSFTMESIDWIIFHHHRSSWWDAKTREKMSFVWIKPNIPSCICVCVCMYVCVWVLSAAKVLIHFILKLNGVFV